MRCRCGEAIRVDNIFSTFFLVEMASYVLKYNYFNFDKDLPSSEWHGDGFDFSPELCELIHGLHQAPLHL